MGDKKPLLPPRVHSVYIVSDNEGKWFEKVSLRPKSLSLRLRLEF